MSPTADPTARAPRRPRRRDAFGDGETFGSFTPWTNPPAVYAYACALIGLTPVLGLVFGPLAVALGLAGLVRLRRRPEVKGLSFARAGLILGALDFVFNAAGLTCIVIGWLGG
jgi:hypothetical protein